MKGERDKLAQARRAAADPQRAVMAELQQQIRADPTSEHAEEARALLARWKAEQIERKEAKRAADLVAEIADVQTPGLVALERAARFYGRSVSDLLALPPEALAHALAHALQAEAGSEVSRG